MKVYGWVLTEVELVAPAVICAVFRGEGCSQSGWWHRPGADWSIYEACGSLRHYSIEKWEYILVVAEFGFLPSFGVNCERFFDVMDSFSFCNDLDVCWANTAPLQTGAPQGGAVHMDLN